MKYIIHDYMIKYLLFLLLSYSIHGLKILNPHTISCKMETEKQLITLAPAGKYGYYQLGICHYIKQHYDLTNYIFSGASAGAWNSLFMTYNKNDNRFIKQLLQIDTRNIEKIIELELQLKDKIIKKYSTRDFDLEKLYIGAITINNTDITTEIYNDFIDLSDALDCCIASSHIPIMSGSILNFYKNKITIDGGFVKDPYIKNKKSVLHITPTLWNKEEPYIGLNFKVLNMIKKNEYKLLIDQLKGFLDVSDINPTKLYKKGYSDTYKNREKLDILFNKKYGK